MDFLQILWHFKGDIGQWAVDSAETETGPKKVSFAQGCDLK